MGAKLKNLKFEFYSVSEYRSEIYGISAIWIMLFHAISIYGLKYYARFSFLAPLHEIFRYGNMGVDLFLFCSGASLYFSFSRNRDGFSFFKRRMRKIVFPLLVIDGSLWFVLHFILSWEPALFFSKIFLVRFWISGDSQVWFISLIVICYFCYPYLYDLLFQTKSSKSENRHLLLTSLCLLAAVVLVTFAIRAAYPTVYSHIEIALTRIPIFLIGCICGKFIFEKKKLPGWVYLIVLFVGIVSFYVLYKHYLHNIWLRYLYIFCSLSLVFLIPLVLRILHFRPLNRCLRFFGNLSLDIYLSHIMLHHVCDLIPAMNIHRLYQYLLMLVASVILAWIVDLLDRKLLGHSHPQKKEITA